MNYPNSLRWSWGFQHQLIRGRSYSSSELPTSSAVASVRLPSQKSCPTLVLHSVHRQLPFQGKNYWLCVFGFPILRADKHKLDDLAVCLIPLSADVTVASILLLLCRLAWLFHTVRRVSNLLYHDYFTIRVPFFLDLSSSFSSPISAERIGDFSLTRLIYFLLTADCRSRRYSLPIAKSQ